MTGRVASMRAIICATSPRRSSTHTSVYHGTVGRRGKKTKKPTTVAPPRDAKLPFLRDLPSAHVLHVVRNPWSAYADTKKRPVPLPLEHYLLGWTLCQSAALLHRHGLHERQPHVGQHHVRQHLARDLNGQGEVARADDAIAAPAQDTVGDPAAPGVLVHEQEASQDPWPAGAAALGPYRVGAHGPNPAEAARFPLGLRFPEGGDPGTRAEPRLERVRG